MFVVSIIVVFGRFEISSHVVNGKNEVLVLGCLSLVVMSLVQMSFFHIFDD